ncbi:MAG: cob(I)yrinic acid a,c-diamide adenosyltransferase [Blautia sp.]|nr:cob(I)yrinic acid a,c-diamide adenosyltransferase [Blautia sp.]
MNIYTKNGDRGTTDLIRSKNVSKSDDRIQLVGTIDELTSHIGLVKTVLHDADTVRFLEKIQGTLITLMAGVADPYSSEYRIREEKTTLLEEEIDRLEALFDRPKKFVLPGSNPLSARVDVCRAVARRAERALALVSVRFGADTGAKKYMNRLADYLYVLARYLDETYTGEEKRQDSKEKGLEKSAADVPKTPLGTAFTEKEISESLIREVLRRMGIQEKITLPSAKRLIECIEKEADRRGMKAVIAVCNPEGNPIAVHVMDGAFLPGFDAAMKKAYTSVAVKMSTMEFGRMAQPGGTFYGVDQVDNGRLIIFGGGVPLKDGDSIIGGLGISGSTGEEDHSLCEYALSILPEILAPHKG